MNHVDTKPLAYPNELRGHIERRSSGVPVRPRRARVRTMGALIIGGLTFSLAACVGGTDTNSSDSTADGPTGDSQLDVNSDCVQVPMAVSSEKITLLTELAQKFNDSGAAVGGQCIAVSPTKASSGGAAVALAQGWPDEAANGPKPVIWSPAASGWGGIANEKAGTEIAPTGTPFMLTPLVIAMPQPMAEALGYPDKQLGFADLVTLANDPEGWASVGHPEWGPFRLGKTNPNYSTSGLNFTVAEYYAATGKTSGLTTEDLKRPEAVEFAKSVESAVVHYGDITMTFLNNWFAADARGTSLTYASAVAVEEKSVIDYNMGNPDGELSPGEQPRKPRVPLVAIYPKEGTLYSDNPFFILNTDWVTDDQRDAAKQFEAFVQLPENQKLVMEYGFRPNNPSVALAAPLSAENGIDPNQPTSELQVPEPAVLVKVLDSWAQDRKAARVLLVLDVSGSMGDRATSDATKLDLAQQAAVDSLGDFKPEDEVGLWVFSTNLPSAVDDTYREDVPVGPMKDQRSQLAERIQAQLPVEGTPLYSAVGKAYDTMIESYNPDDINAVVVLTDGVNDDGDNSDDRAQFDELIAKLSAGSEGATSRPVRVFTISYGEGADTATLSAISTATAAAHYDASDPATIQKVFTAVISNF